jgi:hypothetical protein
MADPKDIKRGAKPSHGQTVRMRPVSTPPGSAPPSPAAATIVGVSIPPPPVSTWEDLPEGELGRPSPIEVKIVRDGVPEKGRRPWRALELWTKNRLYAFDSNFTCIEVLDRGTGKPHADHPMIGARLGGGRWQHREKSGISYPLPLPGGEAMLVQGRRGGSTSVVERVILRIRVVDTSDEPQQTWEDVAAQWQDTERKKRK